MTNHPQFSRSSRTAKGVLLLDRFAEGPSAASSLAGYAYHFWNGASFGVIYAAVLTAHAAFGISLGLLLGWRPGRAAPSGSFLCTCPPVEPSRHI